MTGAAYTCDHCEDTGLVALPPPPGPTPGPLAPMRAELEALVASARERATTLRHAAGELEQFADGVQIILERYEA